MISQIVLFRGVKILGILNKKTCFTNYREYKPSNIYHEL